MHGHPTGGEGRFNLEGSFMQRDVLPVPDRPHEGRSDRYKGRFDTDELPRVAMARQ